MGLKLHIKQSLGIFLGLFVLIICMSFVDSADMFDSRTNGINFNPMVTQSNSLPRIDQADAYSRHNNHSVSRHLQTEYLEAFYQTGEIANYGNYSWLFEKYYYPPDQYVEYQGLDWIALYATSVSISDHMVVIGSNGYNVYKGLVHIYRPVAVNKWIQEAYLYSPAGANGNFGICVDHDGGNIIVGANAYNGYIGAAYIYQNLNGYWILVASLMSPMATNDGFGYFVAIQGNTSVVATAVNNAFIYQDIGGHWTLTASLTGPHAHSKFGKQVGVFGNYVVVGCPGYLGTEGAVFIYNQTSMYNWTHVQTLYSVTGYNSQFGFSVSIHNSTIGVGAVGFRADTFQPLGERNENNTGWAYLYYFDDNAGQWYLGTEIQSPIGESSYFGVDLHVHGDNLIVGADGAPNGNTTGAAFIYYRNKNNPLAWTLNISLPSPAGKNGHFGYATDICDSYAVSGANTFQELRGSVYLIALPKPEPFEPTLAPVAGPGQVQDIGNHKVTSPKNNNIILALGAAALVAAACTVIGCCCCWCAAPPVAAKKKKKEEEESPYTVHSYAGYSEMDEYPVQYAMMPTWIPYMPQIYAPPIKTKEDIKKKDKKSMDEGFLRKLFPYKVYSYRGYQENEGELDAQTLQEMQKMEDKQRNDTLTRTTSEMSAQSGPSSKFGSLDTIREEDIMEFSVEYPYPQHQTQQTTQVTTATTVTETHQNHYYHSQQRTRPSPPSYVPKPASGDDSSISTQTSDSSRVSFVDIAKQRYRDLKKTSSMSSDSASVSSSDSGSLVDQAKLRYAAFMAKRQATKTTTTTTTTVNLLKQATTQHREQSFMEMVAARKAEINSYAMTAQTPQEQSLEQESKELLHEQSYAFLEDTAVQPSDSLSMSTMSSDHVPQSARNSARLFANLASSSEAIEPLPNQGLAVDTSAPVSNQFTQEEMVVSPPPVQSSPSAQRRVNQIPRPATQESISLPPIVRKPMKGLQFEELQEVNEMSESQHELRRTSSLHIGDASPHLPSPTIEKVSLRRPSTLNFGELMEVKEAESPVVVIQQKKSSMNILKTEALVEIVEEKIESNAEAIEEARLRALEEESRARAIAQSLAAEEELKHVQERNRLKEESRLRAEEKARARFAMFKAKAEETVKQKKEEHQQMVHKLQLSNVQSSSDLSSVEPSPQHAAEQGASPMKFTFTKASESAANNVQHTLHMADVAMNVVRNLQTTQVTNTVNVVNNEQTTVNNVSSTSSQHFMETNTMQSSSNVQSQSQQHVAARLRLSQLQQQSTINRTVIQSTHTTTTSSTTTSSNTNNMTTMNQTSSNNNNKNEPIIEEP